MSRIQSPTHREKRRKRRIRLSILAAVLVVVAIGGSIYWLRSDRFVIASANVSGASFSDPSQIALVTMNDLAGNFLFVYPKASVFFYRAGKIQSDILNNFAAVQSVSVTVQKNPSPARPVLAITVKERQPYALWCGDQMPKHAVAPATPTGTSTVVIDAVPYDAQCYFADKDGFIFSEAPHFSGMLYPVFYGGLGEATSSQGTTTEVIGNSILIPQKFAGIQSFAKDVAPIGFDVISYGITEDPSGDICDLYYGTSTTSYLRVDCDGDGSSNFSSTIANLASFISDPHFSTSTPSGYSYIDLRFGDKIVYKRK